MPGAGLGPVRAEQPVLPGQVETEIAIGLMRQDGMVDAMHVGRDHDPAQHAVETGQHAHVAVVEHRDGVEQHLEDQHGKIHHWDGDDDREPRRHRQGVKQPPGAILRNDRKADGGGREDEPQ